MHRIEKNIEVNVPVRTCYDQWTQFESFPSFMAGVIAVQQLTDKTLRWVAEVGGERKDWNAEIVEQKPNEVISWRSTSGALNNGSVTFTPLASDKCRVTLIVTYEPEGAKEKLGDLLGVLSARISADLQRFKEFIEGRRVATGSWRGEIHESQVKERRQPAPSSWVGRDIELDFRLQKRK